MSKKGVVLSNTLCKWCNRRPKTRDHLFMTCQKSREVRRAVNRWWSVLMEGGGNCHDPADGFILGKQPKNLDLVKNAIFQACCWVLWKGRNEEIFKGVLFRPILAAREIQSIVFSWVSNKSRFSCNLLWKDWVCNSMWALFDVEFSHYKNTFKFNPIVIQTKLPQYRQVSGIVLSTGNSYASY